MSSFSCLLVYNPVARSIIFRSFSGAIVAIINMKPSSFIIGSAAVLFLEFANALQILGSDAINARENHYIVQYHQHVTADDRGAHEAAIHAAVTGSTPHQGIVKTFGIGRFQAYHINSDPSVLEALEDTGLVCL
jgi:hypothetical protein